MIIVFLWIVFALFIGFLGGGRKIGFAGAFFLSLLLSPIIGLIITLCSKDKEDEKYKEEMLQTQQRQQESLSNLQQAATVNSVTGELERLVKLKDSGMLSDEEFQHMKSKVINGIDIPPAGKPKITYEDKTEETPGAILHHLTFNDSIGGTLKENPETGAFSFVADGQEATYKTKGTAVKALHVFKKSGKIIIE